MTCISLPLNK